MRRLMPTLRNPQDLCRRDAGGVLGKDAGLQGPDSVDFGFLDQGFSSDLPTPLPRAAAAT